MWTVRRTVTMPAQLAVAIDAAVAGGAADSISALLATAARRYLDQLTDDRIATHAASLDPDTDSRSSAAPAPAPHRPAGSG